MYQSIHKMYDSWPDDTRIYVGHDYPPADRPVSVHGPWMGCTVLLIVSSYSIVWSLALKSIKSSTRWSTNPFLRKNTKSCAKKETPNWGPRDISILPFRPTCEAAYYQHPNCLFTTRRHCNNSSRFLYDGCPLEPTNQTNKHVLILKYK